ncbi:cytochrome P450 [Obba rivulosa]|uniref:Cytochrome P450 n=1 Tax=Obba rivulosa TaxID=1052685 RepID=A0A8E2DUN2_9APHY|nr:cytochrome P450 [Obba rivulosa]
MPTSLTIVDIGLILIGIFLLQRAFGWRHPGPLPPGPQGLPIIGNVLDMPTGHEWETFATWGERWGDIVSVNLLGQTMVILNSPKLALEMLDKKSAIYSDRPTLTMGGELAGWDRTLVLLRYGTVFRETRRLFSQLIGSRKHVERFHSLFEVETRKFLYRLMRHPDDVGKQVRKTAGSIILMMSHGYKVQEEEDIIVNTVDEAVDQFSKFTAPGAFLVDVFPILKYVPSWMPGTEWKKKAVAWRAKIDEMCDLPYNFVREQMAAGTARPSFVTSALEEGISFERERIVKNAASSLYGAGADTTVSAICSFFLAMTCFPEMQQKAQEEIDAVIGPDRLPTLADRDRLPYVNALCMEVLRWNPVAPLGVPHRLCEDDVQSGYFIPKDAIVIANVWKFLHDRQLYTKPFEFNPDRFIAQPGRGAEQDPREFAFGFGRRICPGLHMADASLFLSCAMSLAVFDISKIIEDGKVIEPVIEYTSGTISHPAPFRCSIKPRSEKAEALILHEHADQE